MKNFWLNKKVLITGHTGFKGSWLSLLLHTKGAKLYGISRNKYSSKKLNLYKLAKLDQVITSHKSDIIDYNNLIKINFPLKEVKKYTLYETNRWDLETVNKNIIKLPVIDYIDSLENYLNLKKKSDFKNYKVFDYRINNQLILK